MKRFIRFFFIAFAMIASVTTTFAQQSTPQRSSQQQRISREQLAEIEAKHIAHELAFNEDITSKFVAVYCNYQKEIWALGSNKRAGKKAMSDKENEERIKQRFAMSEKILNIRQKYYKEYSKFLSQTQIERVYEQERKLMKRHANKRGMKRTTPRQSI